MEGIKTEIKTQVANDLLKENCNERNRKIDEEHT